MFEKTVENSNFVIFLNNALAFAQRLFKGASKNSLYVKNIDNILIFITTLLFFGLLFLNSTAIGLLLLLALIVFLSKAFLVEGFKIKFNIIDFWVILILATALLSTCFSSFFILSVKGLMKAITYFCGYVIFRSISYNEKVSFLIYALAFLVTTESVFAVFQNFIGVDALATWQDMHNLNPEQVMTRVYGTLQPYNPNLLAGFLIAGLPACMLVFFDNLTNKKPLETFLGFVGVGLISLAIVFTGSRGAYLALFTMVLATFGVIGHIIWHDFKDKIILKKLWIYTFVFGVAAVVLAVLSSPSIQHRVASIFAFRGDSSNSFRMNVYASSLQMFLDNWIVGIGVGNQVFRNIYGLYMKTGFDALGAYSVPLEIAVETGIIGLLAFMAFLRTLFVKGLDVFNKSDLNKKIVVSSLLIGVLGMMVHGLFDTIWYRPQIQIVFWFYIAILAKLLEANIEGQNG